MTPAVLLWDFGDTLVDERWMRRAPAECPLWEATWLDVMANYADEWNVGAVHMAEIFVALALRSGMALEQRSLVSASTSPGRPRCSSTTGATSSTPGETWAALATYSKATGSSDRTCPRCSAEPTSHNAA